MTEYASPLFGLPEDQSPLPRPRTVSHVLGHAITHRNTLIPPELQPTSGPTSLKALLDGFVELAADLSTFDSDRERSNQG